MTTSRFYVIVSPGYLVEALGYLLERTAGDRVSFGIRYVDA